MKLEKSISMLMIFLVLIITIGAISAADDASGNETLTVDEIALDDNLKESPTDTLSEVENKTFTDLNTDIADKAVADLESNYVYSDGDSAYANGITIDRELTINGNGKTTLNPNGNLLFNVGENGKLALNDLTIVNNYTGQSAMIQNSGTLILNNVTFTVERYLTTAGTYKTIENTGEMNITNSNFKDSYIHTKTITSSSNLYIYGLISNANKITIENTVFNNNRLYNPTDITIKKPMYIAAILHNTKNMNLNNILIENTYVSYNFPTTGTTPHFEGIIYNEKGTLGINGSIFNNNTIYFPNHENLNLNGIIFSKDTASELIINNSILVDNSNAQKTTPKTIINYKGTATLDNNYWGNNNPDFSKLVTGTAPTSYVALTFTPEEATAGVEKTYELAFKLNDTIITTLPDYTVTINSNKLGSKDVEIENSVGEYKYLPITAGNDTITIDGEEYTLTVNAAPTGSFTDLNNMINESGEVELYADYTHQSSDSAFQTGIPIDKEVTINGNGYTISSSASGLFNIATTGKLTLKNVTLFTDYAFDSPTSKGNIVNNGILNLEDVTITSLKTSTKTIAATILNKGTLNINNGRLIDSIFNYTGASTSAIPYGFLYNYQAAIATIENTAISDNKIETNGKMPYTYGLIYNYRGNLNLNNVNFTDNTIKESSTANTGATNIYGLIYSNNYQTNGKLIIDNCNFENTRITSASGTATSKLTSVIYSNSGDNEIEISNSKFINNTIESNHGVIYGAIYASTKLDISDSIFEDNTGKESGAIYSTKVLTSQSNIFRGNVATNVIYTTSNATITNSILENNIASGCVIYNTTTLNANNNYWETNNPDFTALINGGAPDNYAVLAITGETDLLPESVATYTVSFKTNDVNAVCELPDYTVDLSATNRLSDDKVTLKKGTATFTYFASLDEITDTIKASADSTEKASLEVSVKEDPTAKGTYAELDRHIRKDTNEIDLIKDYTFDDEKDTGLENGFAIDKTLTINGHGFKINSTDLAKLFTVTDSGNLTLKDVVLVTGYAFTGTFNAARPEASFKNLGTVRFDNVTFTLNQNVNTADNYFSAGIYNAKTFDIVNSKFVNSNIATNTQNCFGVIDNNGGTLNIENTLFDSNSLIDNSTMSSTSLDVLIYNRGTLTLNKVNMTNNFMKTPNNGRGLIRGYTDSKVTIDECIFENNSVNSATSNAAGTVIYAESGSMTISNSRFINNTGAISGGAVYSGIAITFENNTFEKNNASSYGGAIYGGSYSIYINNTFKENKAAQGGALYTSGSLQSSKSYPFTKNTFIDNYASKYGGAVYAGSAIGTTQYPIDNNVFINNEALEKGGAIYSTTVRAINTLFQENTAGEGVAIYATSSTACQITYTIFDNNVIKSPTGGLLYVRGTSTLEDNYWGTNTPNFEDLIKVSGGTLTLPANIALIVIEGNETLFESDVYVVSFTGNTSKEIMELPDYAANITSDLNTVTPASIVIAQGESTFTYNAENYGTDTVKVIRNNVEKASLAVTVAKPKETPEFTIVAGDVNYGDALNFTFTVTKGPTGADVYKWTIFSKFGLPLETGNVTQDNKIISTKSYSAGNYTIEVKLFDNEEWSDLAVSDTFEVKQLATEIKPVITVNDNDTVEIQVNIASSYENNIFGEVSCEIDTTYAENVENGKATITTNRLSPNKYTITLNYSGDTNYLGNATEIEFIIKKTVTDEAFNVTKGQDNKTYTFSINLPEDATGNLTVKIVEETESKALENGQANMTMTLPCGPHDVKLTYTGDENYKPATTTISIYIPGEKMPEDDKNATMSIPEGTTAPEFTINLPSNATGEFTVYVDGTPYTQELVNGSATVKVPDLSVGNHTISTAYSGDNNYEGFETANQTVNIPKASIPGGDSILNPTTPEGSDSPSYSINLPGATGNLTVNVDGVNYTKALENGSATVTVLKLAPGAHNITVAYSGDEKFSNISKTTTYNVKAPVIKITENSDITMLYTAKTPYKVLVTVDGKAVVGEYVTMKFDGKTYNVKTDANGYATLKLPDAKPKKAKYTITVEYKGATVSNKVKVNSIIKAKNAKVKKSKKVNKIKVTLKKVNGKYLKGKTITLKIKGKTLKAKTNKKGVATFKVKKNVLKKLKVGKKYKYSVTFGKDTVTKKLTVKK